MDTPRIPSDNERRRRTVLALFVVSGACGLIYEVVWTRQFAAIFGNTVFAASTVLAAFMAGLGLGSVLLGRLADRRSDHLRIYGWLEILVGATAILVPILLLGIEGVYVWISRQFDPSLAVLTLVRFLLSFVVLLVPATLMGGTLPVLSRFVVQRTDTAGMRIGTLYAINTVGAFTGTVISGFVLIRVFGIRNTTAIAVVLNVVVGIIALGMGRSKSRQSDGVVPSSPSTEEPRRAGPSEGPAIPTRVRQLCFAGLGFSGFTALAYEVVFFRGLELVIGTTVYAFATMLATFLAGIALGSALMSLVVDRVRRLVYWQGGLQIALGLTVLVSATLLTRLPTIYLRFVALGIQSWAGMLVVKFLTSFLLLLIPTILLGATFPVVAKIATRNVESVGSTIGRLYLVNTAGAIIGSVTAGFLLIPLFGIHISLLAILFLNLTIGLLLAWFEPFRKKYSRPAAAGIAVAVATLGSMVPDWNPSVMASGVYLYAGSLIGERGSLESFDRKMANRQLLYYREGAGSTVAVHETGGRGAGSIRWISINGKSVASNSYNDMRLQRSIGHLPMLLAPDPRDVLVIGLGTGVTAGSCAIHPGARVEIVEIERAVLDGARRFSRENRSVLDNPRVNVVINDGRNYLLTTTSDFDVITADPIHPEAAGSSSLYSREFYEMCRAALRPNGVMCQWLPLYGLSRRDVGMVMATFETVFEHASVWLTGSDVALIGTSGRLEIDEAMLTARLDTPGVDVDLDKLHLGDPYALVSRMVLGENAVRSLTVGSRINTDNHLHLEYSVPRSLFHFKSIEDNLEWLLQGSTSLVPATLGNPESNPQLRLVGFSTERLDRFVRSRDEVILGMTVRAHDMEAAYDHFGRALSINPEDLDARYHLADIAAAADTSR